MRMAILRKDNLLAMIMCGGKSTRIKNFFSVAEKPLIRINNKYMIEYVIDALVKSKTFSNIIANISTNTPKTYSFLFEKYCLNKHMLNIFHGTGLGYSADLSYFLKLHYDKIIFTVPSDLPLLSVGIIKKIVDSYKEEPCLSIITEKNFVESLGIRPSISFKFNDLDYCYSGISIFNTSKVRSSENIKETYMILNNKEISVNINEKDDLESMINNTI